MAGTDEVERLGDAVQGATSVPARPVIWPYEIWPGSPFVLHNGGRYTIGWQRWEQKKGGPGFVTLRRGAMGAFKVVQRYPLTDEGWREAWQAFASLDPGNIEKVRTVLAHRARKAAVAAQHEQLADSSLGFLPAAVFLGGYLPGTELAQGKPYDVRFLDDRLAVLPCGAVQAMGAIPYPDIETVDIGGPGLVKSGGGFIGGGFGPAGAVEGMAAAAVLNALTTRTKIKTVVQVTAANAELFFLSTTVEPDALRIMLSRALGAVREARVARPAGSDATQSPASGSLVDELAKLGSLLERGLLSREEFETLKARLIADAG